MKFIEFWEKYWINCCTHIHFSLKINKQLENVFFSSKEKKEMHLVYNLKPSQLITTTELLLLTLFLKDFMLHKIFQFRPIIYLFMLIFSLFVSNWFLHLPNRLIKRKIRENMDYFQLFLIEIELFVNSEDNEDRLIKFINLLTFSPKIAWNQNTILQNINQGEDIVKNLNDLYFYSDFLNKNFKKFLVDENPNKSHLLFDDYSGFLKQKIRYFTETFENRINVFFFVAVFFPLIQLFSIGFIENLYLFLILSLFALMFLLYFISKTLLSQKYHLIGYSTFDKKKSQKFEVFLQFLKNISEFSHNHSLEYAFIQSIENLSKKEQELLNVTESNFNLVTIRFSHFLSEFFRNIGENELKIFAYSFFSLLKKNQSKIDDYYLILQNLTESHLQIAKIQKNQLKSSVFKSNVYKMLISLILGVICPLMIRFQSIFLYFSTNSLMETKLTQSSTVNVLFFFFYSVILLNLIFFSLNRITSRVSYKKGDFYSLLIFSTIFIVSMKIWNSLWLFGDF